MCVAEEEETDGAVSTTCERMAPPYPPSEFRVNLEAGLRTALSTGIAFLWMGFGPFEGGLSFFAGVTSIVCVGNSAGQSIERSMQMAHGSVIGVICALLPQWLLQWGHGPAVAGFFLAIFLVVRSRRLTSLGKKFGCVGVTLLVIADPSMEGVTQDWVGEAVIFVRTTIEGGVFALLVSLLPYPRLATRDGALRAQFMCHSLAAAVDACITGFVKGRDEASVSRARLLCIQVRHNLGVVRMELEWSRLELGVMCMGAVGGGLQSTEALEELAGVMEQVLQGVRGMRQSMSDMHQTRAQASFASIIGPALRSVSVAIEDSLEATSSRTEWLPCASRNYFGSKRRRLPSTHPEGAGDPRAGGSSRGSSSVNIAGAQRRRASGAGLRLRRQPTLAAQPSRLEATEQLKHAASVLMKEYNRARKEVLYGLDEHDRPLEARDAGAPEAASATPRHHLHMMSKRDLRPLAEHHPFGGSDATEDEESSAGGVSTSRQHEHDLELPAHVLVMKERQKLGSTATMARGAFMFSLMGICGELNKSRITSARRWSPAHSVGACRFMISGLWKAVQPPPGLLKSGRDTVRLLCRQRTKRASRDHSTTSGGSDEDALPERGESSCCALFGGSNTVWCLKVALALTVCAIFRLSTELDDLFEPSVWIAVTTCFVLESESASAVLTCLLRLTGTVLGAVYGIITAKLSDQEDADAYSFRAYVILLPWVAITCFFRNSSSFAYGALVAAFTSVIIFTGSTTVLGADGEAVSLARIVNTVVGSLIYLGVDILVVPTRARDLVIEQAFLALDAALKEVCINGERLFGARVCARGSRLPSHRKLRSAPEVRAASKSSIGGRPSLAARFSESDMGKRHESIDGEMTWGRVVTRGDSLLFGDSRLFADSRSDGGEGKERDAAAEGSAEEERPPVPSLARPAPKDDEHLRALVEALARQKQYLPLAELEPQLWYQPFPGSAYHEMLAAEEEVLRALTLMSRAAVAISDDQSTQWRLDMMELGTHLASLVQLLKAGLEDARDVFADRGPSSASGRWKDEMKLDRRTTAHGVHLLHVHAEAIRLDTNVNADFVTYIQEFLERGALPSLDLESILRVSTSVISVMGLQRALLTLGHAVATVLDRESFAHYYR